MLMARLNLSLKINVRKYVDIEMQEKTEIFYEQARNNYIFRYG